MNKYVDFVSDEIFLEEVKKVLDTYPDENKRITEPLDLLKKSKSGLDEFKIMFDMCYNDLTFKEWVDSEIIRQNGKSIENKMGEFHQQLLGRVEGWEDLGVGDNTHVDLKNEKKHIYIEIKNRKNTINGDSGKVVREKLEKIVEEDSEAIAYWAYIIHGTYKSEDVLWSKKGFEDNERIRRISCNKVYELVTGDPNALKKTFDAIPKAIAQLLDKKTEFTEEDIELISQYKKYIFD